MRPLTIENFPELELSNAVDPIRLVKHHLKKKYSIHYDDVDIDKIFKSAKREANYLNQNSLNMDMIEFYELEDK